MFPSTVSYVDVSARTVPEGRVARAVGIFNCEEVERFLSEAMGLETSLAMDMWCNGVWARWNGGEGYEVECKHVDYVNLQRISSQGWIGAEYLRKHGSHDV